MSKIKAVDFASYVDEQRNRLVQHCLENGVTASTSDSLENVVSANNMVQAPTKQYKVEFIDMDGELYAPVQWVNSGESATIPATNPTFDSDYLEFVEWKTNGNLANVTEDLYCLPLFRTKYDETTQQRPTYLICYFETGYLNPTFFFSSYNTTNYQNAYIDFGDGTSQQITSANISHTYQSEGQYTVKIWGDKYIIGGQSNYGVFVNANYQYSLIKAYVGENGAVTSNGFRTCSYLKYFVAPLTLSYTWSADYNYAFYMTDIRILIMPSYTKIGNYFANGCHNLKYVLTSTTVSTTAQSAFSNCRKLREINIRDTQTFGTSMFNNCTSLRKLNIKNVTDMSVLNNCGFENLVVPKNATKLGNYFPNIKTLSFEPRETLIDIQGVPANQYMRGGEIILPENMYSSSSSGTTSLYAMVLSHLHISNNMMISISGDVCVDTLTIGQNRTKDFRISQLYTRAENFFNIAKNLADLTGQTTGIFAIGMNNTVYGRYLKRTYIDSQGNEVPKGTTGAVSLLEYITNKNWTVS